MKALLLSALIVSIPSYACEGVYLKVNAEYKLQETDHFTDTNGNRIDIHFKDPLSARIELGIEDGNISYGLSHHSQWRTGFPFNNEEEIQKTELFIDYKFNL